MTESRIATVPRIATTPRAAEALSNSRSYVSVTTCTAGCRRFAYYRHAVFADAEIAPTHEAHPHRVQKLRIHAIAGVLPAHPVRPHVEVAPRRQQDLGRRVHVRQCRRPLAKQVEIGLRG